MNKFNSNSKKQFKKIGIGIGIQGDNWNWDSTQAHLDKKKLNTKSTKDQIHQIESESEIGIGHLYIQHMFYFIKK